jgi:adenine-specific DNA-methyltransferase
LGSTTVYSIILSDNAIDIKYLLGILNSKLLTFYHQNNTIPQAGGFYRYQAIFIKDLPIRRSNDQKPIKTIVDQILSAKAANSKADTSQFEKQIDEMVYKLYELTDDEIAIIEGSRNVKK